MNKTQLIDAIAEKAELSKAQAKAALESTLAAITDSLKEGDAVQLVGFGTFKVNHRASLQRVRLYRGRRRCQNVASQR